VPNDLVQPHGNKHKRSPHVYARELPAHGYVRLETVLAVFPVGKSTWWKGVKDGRYPAGVKLGPRLTAWTVESIRALIERTTQGGAAA
jgi:prophage regulatory protein